MTLNRRIFVVAACSLFVACGKPAPENAPTDTTKEGVANNMTKEGMAAIEALKKLKIKTEVGIGYRDYLSALSDSLYPVTEYLKTKQGAMDTEINNSIREAAKDYLMASDVWQAKLDDTYRKLDNKLSLEVAERYRGRYPDDSYWLEPERALALIFFHAGKEVTKLDAVQ